MGFAQQWKGVNGYMIRDPGEFFEKYDETNGIGYSIAFMLVSYLVVMLPIAVLIVVVNLAEPNQIAAGLTILLGLGVAGWILGIMEAVVVHAILYLFGERGLTKTFEAYAFPILVRNGLWWIPLLNLALGIYGLYLQIEGLAAFHETSTGKAAFAAVLAPLLVFIPGIIVTVLVVATFALSLGSQPEPQPATLMLEVIG